MKNINRKDSSERVMREWPHIIIESSAARRSKFIHHTPLLAVTVLPRWERLPYTVTVGSPGTLISLPGTAGPRPYGSSMLPAQAPNPREREEPFRLTSPAQCLQERDFQRCVRAPRGKMCSRFLPSHRRLLQKGLLGQPHLYMSPKIRRKVTVRQEGILFGHHVQTNQSTCFHCLCNNAGPGFHRLRENKKAPP